MVDRGSLDFNKNLRHINDHIRAQAPVNRQTTLPLDFQPSAYDVICARGKAAWNHIGNRRFRVTIDVYLGKYKKSTSKVSKSLLVMEIVDIFRENSPRGGFVRQDNKSGRWFEVGDAIAREKVGQSLREILLQQDPKKCDAKRARKASQKKARRESEKKRKSSLISPAVPGGSDGPVSGHERKEFSTHSSSTSVSSTALDVLDELVHSAPPESSPQRQKLTIEGIHKVHRSAPLSMLDLLHRGMHHEVVPPIISNELDADSNPSAFDIANTSLGKIVRAHQNTSLGERIGAEDDAGNTTPTARREDPHPSEPPSKKRRSTR